MTRVEVSEAALKDLIRARMREGDCRDCIPTELSPIKPVSGSANWQVLSHPPCSDPCQARLLEVCKDLSGLYDISWPPARGAAR